MIPSASPDQLRKALQRLTPESTEVVSPFERVSDAGFWRRLNPSATVGSTAPILWQAPDYNPETVRRAIAHYREQGFGTMPAVLSAVQVAKMRAVIECLRMADWPAVFAFVYDDFWSIARSAPLRAWLVDTLGENYRLLPRVWAHYVAAGPGQAGWAPHLDGRHTSPLTMSVWIPLSGATVTNGCMYVVKRSASTCDLTRDFHQTGSFSRDAVDVLLRHARALPATPGDVLSWDHLMLHWGSGWDMGNDPRISLALEFSTPERWPSADPSLFVDPFEPPPNLASRLALIGRAILKYERFEPMVARFAPLARKLYSGAV